MDMQDSLRIIVVDDNKAIHQDFIKILTANKQEDDLTALNAQLFGEPSERIDALLPSFQIDTASQGQEGVEYIKKAIHEKKPYALAFVDVRMPPGWDGIETIQHIWELDPDIQVVICTAYSDYTWEETVEKLGQKENLLILKKPFDNITVRQLACALTKKWQLLQETRQYTAVLEDKVKDRTSSLQQSLSVTRGTLESSVDGILVIDNEGNVIDCNQKIKEMWNIPENLLDVKKAEPILEYITTLLEKPDDFITLKNELMMKHDVIKIEKLKSKSNFIYEFSSQPYKLDNKVNGRIWSFRDITKRALLEEKLEYQATHDVLTGLPNRVILNDRLRMAIAKCSREKTLFGVLFFDLDRFKLINDSLSHAKGDKILQEVSRRLADVIRGSDTLARLGGDEFVAVVTSLGDELNIGKVAQKLLDVLRQPLKINDMEILVTSSIGIAIYPRDGDTIDSLLSNADTAMYRSKELGGSQFQFYTSQLSEYSISRLELEAELRRAIINEEFFLCYQPQFDLSNKKVVSAEALIRWNHPKKGVVLPINFIPLAESTGLIVPMGEWVLKTACKENKRWQDMGLSKIRIAVNMASQQFKQPNIVSVIKNALDESGLEAKYLEIELTENVIVSNLESINVINEMKQLGVHIALDDFGTGYSSLGYLKSLPIDRLKIDQSFVQNIDINRGDEVIIQALISMARDLNFDVMAEGVESQKQLDFLKNKMCSEVQGFLFSKPLPNEEMIAYLKKSTK